MGAVCCHEGGKLGGTVVDQEHCVSPASVEPSVDVSSASREEFLSQVELFKKLPKEELPALASCAEPVGFEVGQVIIQQGDVGNDFFILKSGEASVVVDGAEVITLSSGDYVGENALLRDEPRTATIRAVTKIAALRITRESFDKHGMADKLEFTKRQAVGGGDEQDEAEHAPGPKTDEERRLMREALAKNTNLQTMVTLDDKRLNQLIDIAWQQNVPAGKELITEGDLSADFFYIVQSGCFDVVRQEVRSKTLYARINSGAETAELGEVQAGDSFGELALLYLAPRAATVTARVDSVVWVIHRAGFKAVLAKTQEETLAEYKGHISKVSELKALQAEEQDLVAKALMEMSFSKGEVIFKQGEAGKDFYILVEGEVVAVKNGKEAARYTATKDRSHCFGEKALLNDSERAATITVASDKAKALSLDKATFDHLLGPLQAIQKRGRRGQSMVRNDATFGNANTNGRTFGNILRKDLKAVGLLGNGGFGSVQLVEHLPTKNTYAMKALSKGYIVKSRMQKSVMMEKQVQLMCDSPFVIKLYETFASEQHLYLLLELALGGELYATYNKKGLHGKEAHARYYVGGVVLAFEHLHSKKIIFRDLKPENLLLTEKGNIKLTDMGLAKVALGKTYTTCGTPDYFAPELVTSRGHTNAVDWWTLGVLIFELMVGHTPFEAHSPMMIYQKVTRGIGKVHFPPRTRGVLEDLVKALCKTDPSERLPMKKGGTANIKQHQWYKDFNWKGLEDGTLTPPYIPKVKGAKDLGNFQCRNEDMPPTIKYTDDDSGWEKGWETST